jgi:predicted dehydrogenase
MSVRRVLVIGVGSIGERHLRCFLQTGRVQLSFCEINPQLRATIAERYHIPPADTFADFDSALASKPDVAVVCTPAHLHIAMSTRLAEGGVHLLIEKPLSISLDGVENLQRVIREKQIVTAMAYVLRAHPLLNVMRRELQSGRFGQPVQYVVVCGQHFPHFRPAYRDIYYNNRATGGGCIQDALTHMVNAAEWLIGPVTKVAADAAHLVLEGVTVEDTVHAIARHGNVLASYCINQHQAPNETSFTIICERATVRFEFHESRWRWMTGPTDTWHDESHPPMERDTIFIAQANAFLDTLEGKAPPLCTLEEGLQTLKVNLALLKAADTQTWQAIS